jgi:hypothetical protein
MPGTLDEYINVFTAEEIARLYYVTQEIQGVGFTQVSSVTSGLDVLSGQTLRQGQFPGAPDPLCITPKSDSFAEPASAATFLDEVSSIYRLQYIRAIRDNVNTATSPFPPVSASFNNLPFADIHESGEPTFIGKRFSSPLSFTLRVRCGEQFFAGNTFNSIGVDVVLATRKIPTDVTAPAASGQRYFVVHNIAHTEIAGVPVKLLIVRHVTTNSGSVTFDPTWFGGPDEPFRVSYDTSPVTSLISNIPSITVGDQNILQGAIIT